MKKAILFLSVCSLIFLYGCPFYGDDGPCPTPDTLRGYIDSSSKIFLVHKGTENLIYVDILTGDTLTFEGNGMLHGYDTSEVLISPPISSCTKIIISEYYSINFINKLKMYEIFTIKIKPKLSSNLVAFTNYLYVSFPGVSYEKSLGSFCENCIDRDSIKLDNRYFYDVYNVHLYGNTINQLICWNKQWGPINFPTGIIDKRLLIIHSIKK